MKNNILTILAIAALFLLSFDKATSLLTQRSKQQIIVHGNNSTVVVNQINQMYSQGYRVTAIVGQSISSFVAGDSRTSTSQYLKKDEGEIIVIMEK
jgi:hypothetical protein